MMNKKIIVLVGILFCGSFGVTQTIQASVALTQQENVIYQGLVDTFKNSMLSARDNTKINSEILNKQEQFLKTQVTIKKSLWPIILAASVKPTVAMTLGAGNILRSFQEYVNKKRFGFRYNDAGFFGGVGRLLQKPGDLIYDINNVLGFNIVFTLVYTIAPAVAFYSMYKKYSSVVSQQQELEKIREIRDVLKKFGQPA